jgi:hypothetical protein
VIVGSLTIAGPVFFYPVGGDRAKTSLDSAKGCLLVHNDAVMTLLCLVFGVLVVPECLNESVALSVLRLTLDRVGLAARSVRRTVIVSQESGASVCWFANHPHQRASTRSVLPGRARRMPAVSMPPRPDYRARVCSFSVLVPGW